MKEEGVWWKKKRKKRTDEGGGMAEARNIAKALVKVKHESNIKNKRKRTEEKIDLREFTLNGVKSST